MPQLAANLIFNSKAPNFARDQVQTMAELEAYGIGEGKTPIDIGHITFVIEENTHYTYVELADDNGHGTGEYAWVPFTRAPGGNSGENEGGEGSQPQPTSVYAYFKSMVFKRGGLEAPPTPGNGWNPELADYGGTYTDPCPLGWSDGIPSVTNQQEQVIWMSTRIFSSGGQADSLQAEYNWTTPQMIADSASRDYEFSSSKETPAPPQKTWAGDETDYNDGWSNTADESTVWMAMIDVESGIYRGNWEIVKIKGEDGQQATIIKILGTKNDVSELPSSGQYLEAFIVISSQGNYVYTWDGDSWNNCGKFKGTYDPSKNWAYLHIKYSDDGHTFTAAFGEVPGGWVGTYCDYEIDDSTTFSDYYWKEIVKEDAFGKEEIFYLTSTNEAPRVPTSHDTYNGKTWEDYDFVPPDWYDDYPGVSTQARYCWYCSRRKIDGVWDEFRGVDGKTGNEEGGVAKLYIYLPADAVASAASRTFMAYTWTSKTPSSTADNPVPIVPEPLAADVATWDVQNNTLVLAEDKSWQTNTDTTIDGAVVKATWSTNPGDNPGKYLWLSTATFSEAGHGAIVGVWSDPVCISGEDGRNGTDGEWKAFAYKLCKNRAEFSTLSAPTLSPPYKDADDFTQASIDLGWKDHPEGISEDYPIEAASIAIRDKNTEEWTYDTPFIWSRWGEDGIDGDGVEYLYFIATADDVQDVLDPNTNEPTGKKELKAEYYLPQNLAEFDQYLESIGITDPDAKSEAINTFYTDRQNEWLPDENLGQRWTDDPSDVSQFEPYEFVSMRKYRYDSSAPGESEKDKYRWGFWSKPALWAKFGQDGAGRSVFTSMVFCRTSRWKLDTAELLGGTMADPKPTSTWIDVVENEETKHIDLQKQEDNDPPLLVWSDSVPSTPASAPVWMASRVFNTDESTPWSTPVELHDAPGFQVEYTAEEKWNYNALPSLNNPRYHDDNQYEGINEALWRDDAEAATQATWGDIGTGGTDIVDPWWMITSRKTSGGQWTNWAIFKIKGEKGETGTSIHIKGSFDSYKNLGDPTIDPDYGRVNHTVDDDTKVADGDCYVVKGLLWIYDGNSTETLEGPYSEAGIRDTSNIENGDQYAGFICQGQFKGDPGDKGESSWLFIRFANESDDQETEVDSTNEDRRYKYNNKVFIEFTDNYGTVPGKYSGTYIARENSASLRMKDYTWSEWRGDDLYGTEQIFILSALNPCQDLEHLDQQPGHPMPPEEENANEDKSKWYEFEHVPTGWSDGPLTPTPDAHCWVSTRRLSDPEDKEWKTPVIYSRYAKDGDRGEDGVVNEFIYHLGEEGDDLTSLQKVLSKAKKGSDDAITIDNDDWWESDESRDYRPGDGTEDGFWTDNPSGVLDEAGKHVEYYCYRTRDYDEDNNLYFWTTWSPIKVWSTWGKKGNDGDGIEYIFTRSIDAESANIPTNPTPYTTVGDEQVIDTSATGLNNKHWNDYDFVPSGWTDDPQGPDDELRFEWVSIRRSHSEDGVTTWGEFSDPSIWSMYVEDGKDGNSQEFIFKTALRTDPKPTVDNTRAKGIENGTTKCYGPEWNSTPDWQKLTDFVPAASGSNDNINWWSDNPTGISESIPLEYYSVRFKKAGEWSAWSPVKIWSEWGEKGHDGDGVEYIFRATGVQADGTIDAYPIESRLYPDNTPKSGSSKTWADDDFVPEGWDDDPPQKNPTTNRHIWVSKRKSVDGSWGTYADGRWSPPVEWITEVDAIIEQRVYHYGTKTSAPNIVQWVQQDGESVRPDGYQNDNYLPKDSSNVSWKAKPQGITSDDRYEWEAIRSKDPETGIWGDYGPAHLYSVWGNDGNGIEFVFWLLTEAQKAIVVSSQNGITPYIPDSDATAGASDEYRPYINLSEGDLQAVDESDDLNMTPETPYIYASKRIKKDGVWQPFGKIFIFNQLNLEPDYACTLNLSEDFQGVAVVPEVSGDYRYKSLIQNVSAGNNIIELKHGPSDVEIGKISIEPLSLDPSGKYVANEEVVLWTTANGSGNSRTVTVDGNQISFTISKTGGKIYFSWGSLNNIKFKEKDSVPANLSFSIYAEENTSENPRSGVTTYNIHPIIGEIVYELDPKVDIFKKLSDAPYNNPNVLIFEIIKNTYSDGTASSVRATYEDWNSGDIVIKYKKDSGSDITISGQLTTVPDKDWAYATSGSSGSDYSWEVRGYDNPTTKKVVVAIILGNSSTDFVANIQDGITASLYYKNDLHDSEYIPAVYDGKKGARGDYWKYEEAFYLKANDTAPSAPASNVTLATPTGTASSDIDKWLKSAVSPTADYRYLFKTRRLNRYYGDNIYDDNNTLIHRVNTEAETGTWETVILYASRSLPGDAGRGISSVDEYYQWTTTETKPSAPGSGWVHNPDNSVPARGTNERYLWNYEVVHYVNPTGTETSAVEFVGSIGENGVGIKSVTEYYFWSHLSAGSGGTYTTSGSTYAYPAVTTRNNSSSASASWWSADHQTELNSQSSNKSRCYLWNFELITYDDNTTNINDVHPARIGETARSVEEVHEYYQWNNSNSVAPGTVTISSLNIGNSTVSGWYKDQVPGDSVRGDNKCLWNFEVIVYSYGNMSQTVPAFVGSIGENGVGISSVVDYYFWSHLTSGNAGTYTTNGTNVYPDPTDLSTINDNTHWCDTSTSEHSTTLNGQITDTRRYLWNFEVITYNDASSTQTASRPAIIAINGTDGDIGNGVQGITEYYLWTDTDTLTTDQNNVATNITTYPDPTATSITPAENRWSTSPSKISYLWNNEIVTVGSTSTVSTNPRSLGEFGPHKPIASITHYYLACATGSGITAESTDGTGWGTEIPAINNSTNSSTGRKYLWAYEKVVYGNGDTFTSTPSLIHTRTASSTVTPTITETYFVTSDSSLSPSPRATGWTDDYATATATPKYLWNFEEISYTTGSRTRTVPAIVGSAAGVNGRGIVSVTEYYFWSHLSTGSGGSYTDTGTVAYPTQSTLNDSTSSDTKLKSWWSSDHQTELNLQTSETRKYLWNFEAVVYSDSPTPVSTDPMVISIRGDRGDDGRDYQFVYFLSRNLLTGTFTDVPSGWVTVPASGSNFEEKFPCWKYGTDEYIANADSSISTTSNFQNITDDPSGVTEEWPYEYESQGQKNASGDWHFSTPTLKNNWAEPGTFEYAMYKAAPANSVPHPTTDETQWPSSASVTSLEQYDWTSSRQTAISNMTSTNTAVWKTTTRIPVTKLNSDGSIGDISGTSWTWAAPSIDYQLPEKGDSIVGPTLRGPVKWTNATGRRWCAGDGATGTEDSMWIDIVTYTYTENDQEVTHYYRCIQSHNSGTDAYIVPNVSNSEYWIQSNVEYKFVAAEVLLAENAKIKALSNNALYLMDGDGDIVGGAKGSTSNNVADKDIIFWAGTNYPTEGSDLASAIESAKFRVTYGGEMTSTAGTIGGWTIGSSSLSATNGTVTVANGAVLTNNLPEISLSGTSTETYSVSGIRDVSDFTMKLTASGIVGSGTTTTTLRLNTPPIRTIVTERNLILSLSEASFTRTDDQSVTNWDERLYQSRLDADGLYVSTSWSGGASVEITATGIVLHDTQSGNKVSLSDGRIITEGGNIETDSGNIIADGDISASGNVTVGGNLGVTGEARISGSAYLDAAHSINGGSLIGVAGLGKVVSTHGKLNLKIAIITDDTSLFTHDSERWLFNGDSLEIPYDSSDVLSSSQNQYVIAGNHDIYFTGIFDSSVDRRGTTIYIEI